MLAILSDLHLSDGSTSANVHPQAFEILRKEIETSAKENEAKEVQLLLLGDIFDLVRTDWWLENSSFADRPWNGLDEKTGLNKDQKKAERQFQKVLENVFAHKSTQAFIKMVRRLADAKAVPGLKVSYVIGNHDRVLNNYPSLQKYIGDQIDVPIVFGQAFTDLQYAVSARHGHQWDENCSARLLLQEVLQKKQKWDPLEPAIDKVMAIGEVVTAELMSGLVWHIGQSGDPLLTGIIKGADRLRPATDVFQWIEWRTISRKLSQAQKDLLANAMREAISGVVDSELGRLWDDVKTDFLVSGDLVDRLELVRSRLKASGYDGLKECLKFLVGFKNIMGSVISEKDDCYEGAKREFERCDPAVEYVIYGHTHRARHDYLAGSPDGRAHLYINIGTYLPLLQTTDDGRGFAESNQMTLTFFYNEAEDSNGRADKGPTLDLWHGIKRKNYLQP